MEKLYGNYEYDKVYNKILKDLEEETEEEKIEDLRMNNNYVYVTQTITSGDMVESEIYPVWKCRSDVPRVKKNVTREAQKKLNNKNAQKKVIRLVNTNFNNNDLMVTLTYDNKHLPNYGEARRDIQNYIKRLKRYRKKMGLSELKYLYTIEFAEEESKKVRVHHHIIINNMERDVVEELWGKGYANAKKLKKDDFGLEGMARYIAKDLNGTRRWSCSRNLKQPKVTMSRTRLTKRKVERMVKNQNMFKDIFERVYPGCNFRNCDIRYSDVVGGFYLYAKLQKSRNIKSNEHKEIYKKDRNISKRLEI